MNLNDKVGLGTVQFGMSYGISNEMGQTSEAEVRRILSRASKYQINFIDTASVYGNAELILGNNNLGGFKVISKFMPPSDGKSITDQFNQSLEKLKIDSLYGYLAHRPLDLLNKRKQWDELIKLKEDGRLKKIGYSLNWPDELEQLLNLGMFPDLIQVPFNYFDDRFKNLMIELKSKKCEVHTRSSFLQGLFFMNVDKLSTYFNTVKTILRDLQNCFQKNLSGALLKHVLSLDYVDVVIIGVENEIQLVNIIENVATAEKLPLLTTKINENILIPSMWPKA